MSALLPALPLPKLPGIDVSSYQGHIDWALLAPHIRFAFIKATDGPRVIDSRVLDNIKGATDNGVPFGLYHFSRNGGNGEADRFLEIFNKHPSQLPPVLDLETHPSTTALASFAPSALVFLEAVNHYARPMVYTSPSFASTYLNSDFSHFPLWIAHYTHGPQPNTTSIWSTWDFWQWNSDGKLPGIADAVDLDWCLDETTLNSLMRILT